MDAVPLYIGTSVLPAIHPTTQTLPLDGDTEVQYRGTEYDEGEDCVMDEIACIVDRCLSVKTIGLFNNLGSYCGCTCARSMMRFISSGTD